MPNAPASLTTVLLVDPLISRSGRRLASLKRQAGITPVGCAKNLAEAMKATHRDAPDLVVIDADFAHQTGFHDYTGHLKDRGIPTILVAANEAKLNGVPRSCVVLRAHEIRRLEGLGGAVLRFLGPPPRDHRAPAVIGSHASRQPPGPNACPTWRNVVIGASTGGIEALITVLSSFPDQCPPTAIVQHIGGNFLEGLTRRLNRHCAGQVRGNDQPMKLESGMVYLAANKSSHLVIAPDGARCSLASGPPVSGHRPSVDALFHSASRFGPNVVGVLLTGMGRDGAEGLAALRKAGGVTIAQDQASSTVYGMPRAAYELGAVQHQLSLDEIGPAILRAAAKNSKENAHVTT